MRQTSPEKITNFWLRQYILIGYAAKGIVYLLIGILAVQAAILRQEAVGDVSQSEFFSQSAFWEDY